SKENEEEKIVDEESLQDMTEEEQMMALMGFGGFDTTKGRAVPGNNAGLANVKKQRKYRQYMNRKGGFNRPLDKQ
ncbi:U4/U6.U5 small nuclear ribonucleoprotein, partial [Dipsacomyces acuminosporus]